LRGGTTNTPPQQPDPRRLGLTCCYGECQRPVINPGGLTRVRS
jgi:hypothetical protein